MPKRKLALVGPAAAVAIAISFLGFEAAGAAPPPGNGAAVRGAATDARALDLFEQSAKAYREGRFQDAVDRLLEARSLKSEPVLLYNLGRAYEALGRWA